MKQLLTRMRYTHQYSVSRVAEGDEVFQLCWQSRKFCLATEGLSWKRRKLPFCYQVFHNLNSLLKWSINVISASKIIKGLHLNSDCTGWGDQLDKNMFHTHQTTPWIQASTVSGCIRLYGLVTTLEVRGLWIASYPIVDNMWIQKAVLWPAICRPEQEFYRTDWCTLQYACYLHSVEQYFYNDWFMAIFEHWKDLLRRTVRSARFALVVFQGISIQNLKSFLYFCTEKKVRNINFVKCQKFILQTSWWWSFSERLLKEVPSGNSWDAFLQIPPLVLEIISSATRLKPPNSKFQNLFRWIS